MPSFKALSSLFSGGLGCQTLQVASGNGAWCSSFCLLLKHFQAYFRAGLVARCLRVLGQRCLGQRLLPAFKALSSLFSGGLGCQTLQGAWGNGAWGSSFCLLLKHFQAYFRAGLVVRRFRVLGATVLWVAVLPAFKTLSSLFSGGLGCQTLEGAWRNGAWG